MTNALVRHMTVSNCSKANVLVDSALEYRRFQDQALAGCAVTFYQTVTENTKDFFLENLYISDLFGLSDSVLDAVIERVLGHGARLIVSLCRTLQEVGVCDVMHGCDPIAYLHRLGLLTGMQIAGGVHLDRDSVDLMVQEQASLILTPSYDAGHGNGIPPLKLYTGRGLKISLGTMDNSFNPTADIAFEAQILRLLVNGTMHDSTLTDQDLAALMDG